MTALWSPVVFDASHVSHYGWRAGRFHHGVDLYAPEGARVVAVADGVVDRAARSGTRGYTGYGNIVVLKHADSTRTLYAHMLDAPSVFVGQRIAAGDVLGHVGSTSGSGEDPTHVFEESAPHLHFETLIGPYPASAGPPGDQPGARSMDPFDWYTERGVRLTPNLRPTSLSIGSVLVGLTVMTGIGALVLFATRRRR